MLNVVCFSSVLIRDHNLLKYKIVIKVYWISTLQSNIQKHGDSKKLYYFKNIILTWNILHKNKLSSVVKYFHVKFSPEPKDYETNDDYSYSNYPKGEPIYQPIYRVSRPLENNNMNVRFLFKIKLSL